eukprot:6211456-Pleurochrysis_carterae.AAC.1
MTAVTPDCARLRSSSISSTTHTSQPCEAARKGAAAGAWSRWPFAQRSEGPSALKTTASAGDS